MVCNARASEASGNRWNGWKQTSERAGQRGGGGEKYVDKTEVNAGTVNVRYAVPPFWNRVVKSLSLHEAAQGRLETPAIAE